MTNSNPKSWRDVLPIHPAAELFPLMSESELRELGENIKTHGLKSHLKLHKGKLLDGRNCLEAMELVGVPVDWSGDVAALGCPFDHLDERVDPYDYVLSANLHRRHLTGKQKRNLIAKVLKAKPAQSNRKIAKQVKVDDKTVAKVRRDLEKTAEIPQLEKTIGADGKARKQPAAKGEQPAEKSKSKSKSVGRPADTALIDFTARVQDLLGRIRKQKPTRFAGTGTAAADLDLVGDFLKQVATAKRSRSRPDISTKQAERSVEERKAKHAALDADGGGAAP